MNGEQQQGQFEGEAPRQEGEETDAERLERLRSEVAEMEKRLAQPEVEEDVEMRPEQIAEDEGKISKEAAEGFSAPSAPPLPPTPTRDDQAIHFLDFDQQVQKLCDLAFQKGVEAAIKTAKDLNNAYILDAFHDAMVDELYKRLIEEKKIMEI